ncbi:hypothetical protein ACJIZ3_007736 [Penstemon smallii]|uniref:RING-type domain-containing protein n=1 Tax=Penstemon smallii TaxID=265156 RepID=A0ABD3T7S6_9LAMI
MAGSKRGKHSKRKGKSKSTKSDAISEKGESSNSELDLWQISNTNFDGPKDFKEKNHLPNLNSSKNTRFSKYKEDKLEEFLYVKLEELYTKAKSLLSGSGYSERDVERAFLNNGYVHGPEDDLLNNILANSIAFLENKLEPRGQGFKDMSDLYKTMLETLVDFAVESLPDMPKADAMYKLLVKNWGSVPSITVTAHLQSENQNPKDKLVCGSYGSRSYVKNEDSCDSSFASEKVLSANKDPSFKSIVGRINMVPSLKSRLEQSVPILSASIKQEIGAPVLKQHDVSSSSGNVKESSDVMDLEECIVGWVVSDSANPKVAQIVDLFENIRDLLEEAEERKKWAWQKVVDSAKRVSKDLMELWMLRKEKFDMKQMQNDKKTHKKSCLLKIMEMEQSLQSVKHKAYLADKTVKRLETKNAQIRADMEGYKLSVSESERELKDLLKRERRLLKKCTEKERQRSGLKAQCEEDKQRMKHLQHELLRVEKEAEETEMKWRQTKKEKEQMLALLAEETQKLETQKVINKAKLAKLRQKLEMESQQRMDECRRLEDELSRLLLARQMSEVSVKDEELYDSPQAIAFVSRALSESSEKSFRERYCMICWKNEVNVVFLPCSHQVVCFPCCEGKGIVVGSRCPYCQVEIEQSIKVYGPSS